MLRYDKDGHKKYIPSIDLTDVYNEGRDEARAECAMKHFVGTVVGDGTNTLIINLPFKPDIISICCADAAAVRAKSNEDQCGYCFRSVFDFGSNDDNATARVCGVAHIANKGGYTTGNMVDSKAAWNEENMTVSIQNVSFGSSLQYSMLFAADENYIVIAEKHTE
jgi:hypothetical protein